MIARTLEPHLQRLAQQYPVITLTGPRQSGKTTLCRKLFTSHAYVNLEDLETRRYAVEDPRGFLAQFPQGVILDEIQRTPDIPSYLQGLVDAEQRPGRFILTGSQQFEVTQTINQSLAGRTAICKLLPFSYTELYQENKHPIADVLYKGFYPSIHDKNLSPTEALSFYLSTYVERDIRTLLHIKDLLKFERFLKLCAGQIGQLVNYSRLGSDCGIDQKTVKSWLSLLEASYILFQVQPHFENFRKRLTKSSKLYFYDIGLATYLLGITNTEQVATHPLRGALFENFIVSEFLKNRYHHVQDNNLYFFRDQVGHEVDLVLPQGVRRLAVEIKASETINKDFFKDLHYYHTLSPQENYPQILVYGGDQQTKYKDVMVYPYYALSSLYTELEKT